MDFQTRSTVSLSIRTRNVSHLSATLRWRNFFEYKCVSHYAESIFCSEGLHDSHLSSVRRALRLPARNSCCLSETIWFFTNSGRKGDESTKFAGWGGEDDNFSRDRLTPSGHEIVRFDSDVSRYRALKHKTNRGNKTQVDRGHNRISKVQFIENLA